MNRKKVCKEYQKLILLYTNVSGKEQLAYQGKNNWNRFGKSDLKIAVNVLYIQEMNVHSAYI